MRMPTLRSFGESGIERPGHVPLVVNVGRLHFANGRPVSELFFDLALKIDRAKKGVFR